MAGCLGNHQSFRSFELAEDLVGDWQVDYVDEVRSETETRSGCPEVPARASGWGQPTRAGGLDVFFCWVLGCLR